MKKVLLGLLGLFISFVVISQSKFYILTEDIMECTINVTNGDIFDCSEKRKSAGTFIIDDDYSNKIGKDVFIHIVPNVSSVYDVRSLSLEGPVLIVENTSDRGNDYIHYFDFENKYISIIFMNENELKEGKYRRMLTIKIAQVHIIN